MERRCADAVIIVNSAWYKFASISAIVTSSISIVFFFLTVQKLSSRMHFHINAKILIYLNILTCLIISSLTIFSYSLVLGNAARAVVPCDYLFKTSSCSIIRRLLLCSFILLTTLHAAILIERAYATFSLRKYENNGMYFGISLAIISIFISISTVYIVTYSEDENEYQTSCLAFSNSASIGQNVYTMFEVQLCTEVLIYIAFKFLRYYNKKKILTQISSHLNDKFQSNENLRVLNHLGPLIRSISFFIAFYIGAATTIRIFKDEMNVIYYKLITVNIFIIPHISCISICLIYFMVRKTVNEQKTKLKKVMNSQNGTYLNNTFQLWEDRYDERKGMSKKKSWQKDSFTKSLKH